MLPSVISVTELSAPTGRVSPHLASWLETVVARTGRLEMCKLFNLISKITDLIGEVVGAGLVSSNRWLDGSGHKSYTVGELQGSWTL